MVLPRAAWRLEGLLQQFKDTLSLGSFCWSNFIATKNTTEKTPKWWFSTLPKTNIAPENGWLEYDSFPLGMAYFQGLLLLVSGRVREMTLPKTNSSPLKIVVSNRNLLFQRSIFRGFCC